MNDTLTKFLKYWKKCNYEKMYALTTLTWRLRHTKSHLKDLYVGLKLESFSIKEEEKISDSASKIKIECRVNGKDVVSHAMVIRENKPYESSVSGNPGVNPISVMRLL